MYKLFLTAGLIALNASLTLALPLQAQQVQTQRDCAATIADAQTTIEKGRKVQVSIRSRNISEDYPGHPYDRNYEYYIVMEGAATQTVVNSPHFMKIIATRLINNCNSIALVSFGSNGSDNIETFGLMENQTVKHFKCLEPGQSERVRWGYVICP